MENSKITTDDFLKGVPDAAKVLLKQAEEFGMVTISGQGKKDEPLWAVIAIHGQGTKEILDAVAKASKDW